MTKKESISASLARKVKERDDYTCVKCGHHRKLEIHHIVPRYKNGTDTEGNLITLCHRCHKEAPDEPLDFIKWACKSLPPELDRSRNITKAMIQIIKYNPDLNRLFLSKLDNDWEILEREIDNLYHSFWKVHVTNDVQELSKLFEKYSGSGYK